MEQKSEVKADVKKMLEVHVGGRTYPSHRDHTQYLVDFAHTLLEQCIGENLTMEELDKVLTFMRSSASETTLRDGLNL